MIFFFFAFLFSNKEELAGNGHHQDWTGEEPSSHFSFICMLIWFLLECTFPTSSSNRSRTLHTPFLCLHGHSFCLLSELPVVSACKEYHGPSCGSPSYWAGASMGEQQPFSQHTHASACKHTQPLPDPLRFKHFLLCPSWWLSSDLICFQHAFSALLSAAANNTVTAGPLSAASRAERHWGLPPPKH